MAKFNEREGSSCHIHMSLRGLDEAGFERFVAGQLACLRELTLLYAPNVNSYKRFAAGSFAPTAVAWGNDNRTCAVRVVGHGESRRFELRVPGADVNPYLALSAMIAAGLHGLDAALELEEPVAGNAYVADKPHVPSTLRAARGPVRGQRCRSRGLRRGRRRPLPQQRRRRARGLRGRGHRLGASTGLRAAVIADTLFAPVQSTTAFEETLERLGTAIKLGLLEPGARLPAERELCEQLGIARSTLRQALTALVQSGHLHALRGRGGGTFVADTPPAPGPPSAERLAALARRVRRAARGRAGRRRARRRAGRARAIERLDALVAVMASGLEDFDAYRPGRRALPHRARRGDGLPRARGRDDRVPGRDDRPDRPDRRTRPRCSRGRTRSTRGSSTASSGATERWRCGSWPTTCAARSTCSPGCSLDRGSSFYAVRTEERTFTRRSA